MVEEEEHTEYDSDSESDMDSSESKDGKALGGGPPELESDTSMDYEENINGSNTSMAYEENINKHIIDNSKQVFQFENTSTIDDNETGENDFTAEIKINTEEVLKLPPLSPSCSRMF